MAKRKKQEKQKSAKQLQQEAKKAKDVKTQKMTMNIGMGIGGIVLVLIVIAIVFADRPPPGYIPESADLLLASQPSLGEPDAPLQVVEFGDYQCGHCRDFHETIYPEFKEDYIDTGQAQFHFIAFPVTGLAGDATANAAMCMYVNSEEGFWQLHDVLFENMEEAGQLVGGQEAIQELITNNVTASYDQETVFQCIRDQDARELVDANIGIAASAGIATTPTLLVNRRLTEARRLDFFNTLEEELAKLEGPIDQ